MGRGLAASTFAVSRFLFHGEFMGLPPPPLLQRITSASQKLVDRGVPQDSSTRSPMPGVPGLLLSGAPSQGGFGLLPWKQHMLARHAVWACKLLGFLACDGLPLQPMQVRRRRELQAAMQAATPGRQRHLRNQLQRLQRPPHRAAWMSLTPLILLTASPYLHPAFHLLALARAKPGVSGNLPEASLPGLLRRIVAALRGLGCPADLTPELPLPVGPACSHIPVWGNPLLAMEDAQQPPAPFPQQAGAQALQWVAEWATTGFQELAAIPSLTNLSSLLHLCRVTQPAGRGGRVGSREWQRAVWGEEQVARSLAVAVRANPARCATGIFAMWARLPTGWQQEVARQAPLPAPADPQALQRVAVAMVMDRLGWLPKAPPTGRAPAPSPIPILEGATVKCFTRVLMEPATMLRAEANARFVKDALAGMWSPPPPFTSAPPLPLPSSPPATQAQGEAWLASRVPTLWKLPWLNSSKEVMWRLAVNGRITSASQKLVDRGVPQDSSTRSPMPGVPGLLLSGAPSQGGFGLLPWKQHMLARHAVWACKLLGFLACDGLPLQPMQVRRRRELQAAMQAATPGRQRHLRNQLQRLQRPPHRAAWMSLTPLILLTASPYLHPAFHLLALARAKPGVSGNLPEASLPGLLRRIVAALRGLGCPADLTPELPLPVGPACSHIPVWGNPLLVMEDAQQPPAPFPQQAGAQALQWVAEWATTGFQELAAIPSLTNLSSLLHLCRVTQPAGRGGRVGSREWQRAVWGEEQVARSLAVAVRANPARCATGIFAMWARLPTGWQQEVARQAPLPAPADPQALQRVAVAMVMDRLGWLPKAPPTGRAPAPSPIPILEGATVKCFTRVLMEPATMLRAEANARFVKDALAGMWSPPPPFTSAPPLPLPSSPPATQAQGEAWLASRVPTLWKLPWLNSSKEVMWRLAVNGVRRRRELQAAMQAATPGRQRHLRNQLQRLQRPPHRAAWMSLTPLILLTASPYLHPAFHLLALARAKPGVSGNLPEASLPGLLRRIVAALRGLGCPADLTPELPLPVGPACSHIPVWGNPLLVMEDAQQPPAPFPQQAGAQALQWVAEWATTGFQELAAIPSLTNLSSLLHLCRVTQPAGRGGRVGSREWQRAVWGEEQVARSLAVAVRANPARCATGIFAMWARLPTGWQQEVARQAPLPAPADPQALQRVAVAMVMDRLGWLPKAPPTGRAPAPSPIPILEGATVKCFTRVLMEPATMLRAEANARFVKDALAGIVCRYVVGDFWSQVQDFVALHTIPHNWPAGNSIPHNHPFICTHGDGQARQLRTHLPDIGAIEDMLPVDLD
ncbi:hypothetical protein QJQ45_020910 [Haematococcus lacustris]|nr:hypothetical protein QJQ45_020910 [Haematococcus lacustris]